MLAVYITATILAVPAGIWIGLKLADLTYR